jgi:PKD repeat protein
LSNESVQAIVHIAGTDGGVYYGTEKSVYYRNNSMGDWVMDNGGLPTFFNTNIARPLYRDNKIRIASYGKGIWESEMHEAPTTPIARITVDKLSQNVICDLEPFYFEDFSFLNHDNATWSWTFEGGEPEESQLRNPVVTFTESGSFKAHLTITDGNGLQSSDSLWVNVAYLQPATIVSEGFQGDFPPLGWSIFDQDGSGQWSVANVGGFGQSSQSTVFRNYDIDSQGTYDDLRFNFSTVGSTEAELTFDVAYAPYGGQYSDTLEVQLSNDCGETFVELFRQGGATIATAPASDQPFTPNGTQWNTITINLDEFIGENDLLIAFRNIGRWGNNMYVDNVNLQNDFISTVQNTPAQDAGVYPNPASAGAVLNIRLPEAYSNGDVALRIIDLSGKVVWSTRGTAVNRIDLPANLPAGNYILNISTHDKIWNKVVAVVK